MSKERKWSHAILTKNDKNYTVTFAQKGLDRDSLRASLVD